MGRHVPGESNPSRPARRRLAVPCTAIVALAAMPAFAQQEEPRFAGGQGSYQPPLASVSNEALYVNGTGVVALAGPFTLAGGVAGFGWGFGDARRPEQGFEATLGAIIGGGELRSADYLPRDFDVGSLEVALTSLLGGYTHKYRAFDPEENGRFGLTLYAGGNAGFLDLAITNDNGTAHRGFYTLGLLAGGVGQLLVTDWLEVVVYGGARASLYAMVEEEGDPLEAPRPTNLTPELGGNIIVHLPLELDLSLGSVINFMRRDDEQRDLVKVFTAGVSWRAAPPAPVQPPPTPTQEVTP